MRSLQWLTKLKYQLVFLGVNSRDYRAWYGLGQAYEVRKFPYDAIYYYQKATDLRPYDARMWRALANCYQTLQQDDEARDCYKRAAACDKTGKNLAMIQLGRIFEKMGRMSVAIDYYHTVWEQARYNVSFNIITSIQKLIY